MVDELAVFMEYCYATWGNKEGTIMGILRAVKLYHEQRMGLLPLLGNLRVKVVKQGIKRAHVEGPKLRRPLPREMVKEMEGCAVEWGIGGSVSYVLLLRASELFAEGGLGESTQCLRSGLEKVAEREGGSGRYTIGRVYVTLGKDRGRDGTRGGRRETYGDTERRKLVIRRVHGMCKSQYGRFTVSVNVAGTGESSREHATEVRDETGLVRRNLRVRELWEVELP